MSRQKAVDAAWYVYVAEIESVGIDERRSS